MNDTHSDAWSASDIDDTLSKIVNLSAAELAEDSDAGFSLERLERLLKKLRARWQIVEKDIAGRDEKIGVLETEIDSGRCRIAELEADLEAVAGNNNALLDRIASAERELEKHHAREGSPAPGGSEPAGSRRKKIAELQEKIRDYENTVMGMAESLAAHEGVVAALEKEKAALAGTVMGLERDLAALRGQHSQQESHRIELKTALDEQARELGGLNNEVSRLNGMVETLQAELAEKDDAAARRCRHESEDSQQSQEGRAHDLRQEYEAAKASLQEARSRAKAEEIRANELDAVLHESRSERRSLEKELRAQRELVDNLEIEVRKRQNKLDALDSSINRLSAIGTELRDIDLRIDDSWRQPAEGRGAGAEEECIGTGEPLIAADELLEAGDEPTEHLLVAERSGNRSDIHYPITRPVTTIGRSRKCDIRLKSKYISRIHARIRLSGDGVIVEDVGSTNGFLVNSKHRTLHELSDGDVVEFGMNRFRYEVVENEPG